VSGRTVCEFGAIRVETVDWPIVLIEFPERRVSDAELHATLDHVELLLGEAAKNREKIFVVTDLTVMREVTPANQRKFTAEWMKRTADLSRAGGVGTATVTPSALVRGIITALHWLQPSPTQSFAVATRHDAMLKGIELLEAGGVLLSPRLIAYRDQARSA
jgi:hypothetical protein